MRNAAIFISFFMVALFITSCNEEEHTAPPDQVVRKLPAVKYTRPLDPIILKTIKQGTVRNGRFVQVYNLEQAIVAAYEGITDLELAYIPYTSQANKVTIIPIYKGEVVPEMQIEMTQTETAIVIETPAGSLTYHLEGGGYHRSNGSEKSGLPGV